MTSSVFVSVDLDGVTHLAGSLYVTEDRTKTTSVFAYDSQYLAQAGAYPLQPDLPLVEGRQVISGSLPGALQDASPDRWGRNLIARDIRSTASGAGTPYIGEVDYLLGVADNTRQGALRISLSPDGPFLGPDTAPPPMVQLPELHAAAKSVATDDDGAAVKQLLAAGTASLGGARPKTAVSDGSELLLAKFSHPHDSYDQVGLECVALDLATKAGISVPWHDLVSIGEERALLSRRFDRQSSRRVGYISAMTLCALRDGETADYITIADQMRSHTGEVGDDLRELWRRVVFSVAVNNLDDHPRNHGFIRSPSGWVLSPAFDITPEPDEGLRATSIAGAVRRDDCFAALMDLAHQWSISMSEQTTIVNRLIDALTGWDQSARDRGLNDRGSRAVAGLVADGVERLSTRWPEAG